MRKVLVGLVVLAFVASGCGSEEGAEDLSGPVTRTVRVDGTPSEYAGYALAFYPDRVTVRQGDTVSFDQTFTGEPHSVTMGTLVDGPLADFRALDGEEPSDELHAEFGKLPVMLPEGPGDANQTAVNPCFVDEELPDDPASTPCPEADQPEFTGEQAYYSSGYIAPDADDFTVPLADDIEPGEYGFYCNLHGAPMSGVIEVVEADEEIPSQAEVDAEADAAMEADFAPLTEAYEELLADDDAGYFAGYGAEDSESTGVDEFIPEAIETEAGEKVTWTVIGPHTITFNPPEGVGLPLVQAEDGTYHLNEQVMAPAGGPGMPPPSEEAPEQGEGPPEPVEVDGGRFDGKGFRSSGFFISSPAPGSFFSYSLTFTEPGEYRYSCLIHPPMTGTVTVS